MKPYIALIHKDAKSDFGVSFPDLPGCVTAGATLAEARAMAVEALALHLEGMAEDGDQIPSPSPLDEIMADADNRSGVVIVVDPPSAPETVVRINVTMPQGLLERIDATAEANGQSRSGFLAEAARARLSAPKVGGSSKTRGGATPRSKPAKAPIQNQR